MPTGATMNKGGTAATTESDDTKSAPMPVVPFIRASGKHRESAFDVSRVMNTGDQDLGPFDVPAYGYMASIVLLVQATGGTGTAVTLAEDAPENMIKNVQLKEPNGATIYSVSSGYSVKQIHKLGGYAGFNEPKQHPVYSTAVGTSANASFLVRIPVQLSQRDALGSLPNQNSAATFKLSLTLAKISDVFGGTVSVAPTVRIRGYLEAYDQPDLQTAGQTNQTTPPAMNTTQFWSEQQYAYNAGQFPVRLTRMGNYIRNLILIARRGGTSRTNGDADWPDPMTFFLDTRPVDLIERQQWLSQIYERYGYTGTAEASGARDLGVFPYDFAHEFTGKVGFENRDLWLPTLGSSRVEFSGTWAQAGTLTVLTNDVSPVGDIFL